MKKKNKEKAMDGMRTHEPELTGKEKRAVKAWQGENAEKVRHHQENYFENLTGSKLLFCLLLGRKRR